MRWREGGPDANRLGYDAMSWNLPILGHNSRIANACRLSGKNSVHDRRSLCPTSSGTLRLRVDIPSTAVGLYACQLGIGKGTIR